MVVGNVSIVTGRIHNVWVISGSFLPFRFLSMHRLNLLKVFCLLLLLVIRRAAISIQRRTLSAPFLSAIVNQVSFSRSPIPKTRPWHLEPILFFCYVQSHKTVSSHSGGKREAIYFVAILAASMPAAHWLLFISANNIRNDGDS